MLFSAHYLCLLIAGRLDHTAFKGPFQSKIFYESIMLWWWSTLRISVYSRSDHHEQVKELSHLLKSSTFFPISLTCNNKIFFSALLGKICYGQHCCQHGLFPHFHAPLLLYTGTDQWWLDSAYTYKNTGKSTVISRL